MPSLFEPCGLNQLYSLAHGTVPVVRAPGGLADTLINLESRSLANGSATGFVFHEPTALSLWEAIGVALATWPDRVVWEQWIRYGMKADWSWKHSAAEYTQLYEEIIRRVQALPVQSVVGESAPSL
jgi:starch synthase